MKVTVTKEWFTSRSNLEIGLEIGAGIIHSISQPVSDLNQPVTSGECYPVSFGRLISLLRRKNHWSIDALAERADATREELIGIESEGNELPELSTVIGLAEAFDLPPRSLLQKSGLTNKRVERLSEDSLRYAACSVNTDNLSSDEEQVLQMVLKVILKKHPAS